jgi:hypothetical protein
MCNDHTLQKITRATPHRHAARASRVCRTRINCWTCAVLEDGRYDAFIVWAEERDDGLALECTITTGTHRGEVVDIVRPRAANVDALALVGLPCTLVVDGNSIRVEE